MPQRPRYLPTPEQIRDECERIQSGWTADEEREHRTGTIAEREIEIRELPDPRRGG